MTKQQKLRDSRAIAKYRSHRRKTTKKCGKFWLIFAHIKGIC
jgi:hypothetical protein